MRDVSKILHDRLDKLAQSDLRWGPNQKTRYVADPEIAGTYLGINMDVSKAGLFYLSEDTAEEVDYEDALKHFT